MTDAQSAKLIHMRFDSPGVALLTLNRPERRNALSLELFDALESARAGVESHGDEVIALIIAGDGPAFCSGFDLSAFGGDGSDGDSGEIDDSLMSVYLERLSLLCRRLRRMPQIVIGAVHGAALAGGCALVTACDFVFAVKTAQFGYPVHGLGVSPAVNIPTLRQVIGDGAAREMLLSGRLMDGVEAERIGLVSHIVDREGDLLPGAIAFAESFTRKGVHAHRATKQWLNELDGSNDDEQFDAACRASQSLVGSEEARRLLAAFRKQRKSTRTS